MSDHKPRLTILTTAASIGGMERMACGLSRAFVARGWPLRTVFPRTANSAALLEWCAAQGVAAESSPALLDAAAAHRWSDIRRLRAFVRDCAPDVVSLHYGDNFISLKDVIAVRAAGRHRCVVSVYHPTPWDVTGARKRMLSRLAALLSHAVTTCSRATYAILRQAGIPAAKLHLIPCGLRAPEHRPTPAAARARLGLPPGAFVVGCLGRLVPHKAVGDLIEAAARLPDPGGQLRLVIAGDGPERPRLELLAAERLPGRAIFLGRLADVDDFFAACDLFALPSRLEGFGLVYVEAAFHAVPSIGADAGGVPDAIVEGETGLLVPPGDIGALAAALRRLHDDPALRRRLGVRAHARANAELTESVMADHFERVFRRPDGGSGADGHQRRRLDGEVAERRTMEKI